MESARLSVRVHPRAPRNQLTEVRDGLIGAGVTAWEVGDQANAVVVALLSGRLRVSTEHITIVSGGDARVKQVRIETLGQAAVDARLRGLGADARHRSRRRRIGAVGVVTAGLAAAAIVITSGSGGPAGHGASPRRSPARVAAIPRRNVSVTSSALSSATARRRRSRRTAPAAARHRTAVQSRPRPGPGRLPQTARLPSARTHEFAVRMRGLWAAIAGGPIRTARAAFFPEAAYVQLKSVADPAGDFEYRLFYDYRLDIAAAHALLGADGAASRLIRTAAVAGYAHWVPPGVCENRVGYYEQPNARLVYRENGQLRSIGIASLISWRGDWYVVHLGAILRGSAAGVVDDPSAGPGASADAGTC